MKLNRLTEVIFLNACRHHHLRDTQVGDKKAVIKQALINTLVLKNTNIVAFNLEVSITLKFQQVNKTIVQDDTVYVCVEYGYQNIRIYNVNLKETLSLGELMTLLNG